MNMSTDLDMDIRMIMNTDMTMRTITITWIRRASFCGRADCA